MKNRESESSNVSLAKTSKWSSQPSAEEGETMAQKKFLVTGATGDACVPKARANCVTALPSPFGRVILKI